MICGISTNIDRVDEKQKKQCAHIKVSVKPFQRLVGIQRAKPVVAPEGAKLPKHILTNKAKQKEAKQKQQIQKAQCS